MKEIITDPKDLRLRIRAHDVKVLDNVEFIQDMVSHLKSGAGIGLSATQIGVDKRVIIVWHPALKVIMINPEIVKTKLGYFNSTEACLSCPGVTKTIRRHKLIKVKYKNEFNEDKVLKTRDLTSAIIQHEIDHLNGKLIADY